MASPTRWTWVWVNSGSWWWTGVLWFMGSQRVGHDWATELNWTELSSQSKLFFFFYFLLSSSLPSLFAFLPFFHCFRFQDWQMYNCQQVANQNNEMTTFWVMKLLWILVETVWIATAHFTPLPSYLSSHTSCFFINCNQYPVLVAHCRRCLGKLELSPSPILPHLLFPSHHTILYFSFCFNKTEPLGEHIYTFSHSESWLVKVTLSSLAS